MAPPWDRRDTAWAAVLAMAGLLTRWFVRGHSLYSYDSGLLASGIQDFDFDREFPHPPYYPLTIAAGKALAFGMPPTDALIMLAVLASGILAAATYAVGRQLAGRIVGVGAAVLVLLSPTALFNGAVALSYTLEGATSALVAWTAWRLHVAPSLRNGVWAGVALSVAVGVRPSAAFFLTPVVIWACWRNRPAFQGAFVGGLATSLAWSVPMLIAGGGLRDFLAYNGYQSRHVIFSRTVFRDGWPVVQTHLRHLADYVPNELPFLAAVAAVTVVAALLLRSRIPRGVAGFLAVWTLPGFLFYALLYAGWPVHPSGYVLVLAPGIAIACAIALHATAVSVWQSGAPRPAQAIALATVVLVAALPLSWPTQWNETMQPQRDADRRDADWNGVEAFYPVNETAFFTFIQWHWARIEHPDSLVWGIRPYWAPNGSALVQVSEGRHGQVDRPTSADFLDGPFEPPHPIPAWVRKVVLLDDGTGRGLLKPNVAVVEERLPSGHVVYTFDPAPFTFIEQAIFWYDEDGMLDLGTLDPEDRRGL